MMKNYATLAMGLTLCLAANAAPVREIASFQSPISQATADTEMVNGVSGSVSKVAKAPAKVSSIEDFYGDYEWVYYNAFSEESGAGGWQTTYLTFDASDKENTVLITGYFNLVWEATVDVKNNTISIAKQFSMEVEDENTGKKGDCYLTPFRWNEAGDGFDEIDAAVGTLADGVITFDERDLIGLPSPFNPNSFYGPLLGYSNTMTFKPVVTINLSEWDVLSEPAEFEEGWFSPVFTEDNSSIVYNVNIAVNKENSNRILLVEPYNNEVWAQVNQSTTPGYIEIDMTNPDLVMCQTRLYSGFKAELIEEGVVDETYCYNLEGYLYHIDGVDPEEIEERLYNNGRDISYVEDNEVNIYNTCFGVTSNKNGALSWKNLPNYSKVTLPKAYEDYKAGVEGVEFDENAPVKYFNLQGVEVANPEKGQLVIKRQGSKAQKIVVR